jgi:hypothetical protein
MYWCWIRPPTFTRLWGRFWQNGDTSIHLNSRNLCDCTIYHCIESKDLKIQFLCIDWKKIEKPEYLKFPIILRLITYRLPDNNWRFSFITMATFLLDQQGNQVSDDVRSANYDETRNQRFTCPVVRKMKKSDYRRRDLDEKDRVRELAQTVQVHVPMFEPHEDSRGAWVYTRCFDSEKIDRDPVQKILESKWSYWGLLENLKRLESFFTQSEAKDICVLCPRYRSKITQEGRPLVTQVGQSNDQYPDTQVCVGGKRFRVWNPEIQGYEPDRFGGSCREHLRQKMKICNVRKLNCVGKIKVLFSVPETNPEAKVFESLTQIFAVNASDCCSLPMFETKNHEKCYRSTDLHPDQRRSDDVVKNHQVGCIVWGKTNECLRLVKSIPVDSLDHGKDQGIDAIQIVPLKKAIQMATNAEKFLRGTPTSREFF